MVDMIWTTFSHQIETVAESDCISGESDYGWFPAIIVPVWLSIQIVPHYISFFFIFDIDTSTTL